MNTALLFIYATMGLAFWMYSLYRLLHADRRRERWLSGLDLALLGGVGLLSSAAWPLLLPVYGVGWMMSAEGHRALKRIRTLTPAGPAGGVALLRLRLRGLRHGV